jgi:phosphoglycolate phosphatase
VSRPARLIVFDLDGTLVDSSRDLAAAVNVTLDRVAPGTAPLPLDEVRSFIGEGAGRLIARSLARAGLVLAPEAVLPVFLDCYGQRLLDTTRPYPGIVEALDALRPRTLAVLTNKPGAMSRSILDGLALSARFLRVYGGGDFPTRKPDPQGLRRLLEDAAVEPQEAVLVGDSAIDVLTARAAGVRSVGVAWGFDRASLDRERPDVLVDTAADLPRVL